MEIQEPLKGILRRIREHIFNKGIKNIDVDRLYADLNIPEENIAPYVKNFDDIIRLILQLEREEFSNIFLEYNLEGLNAIDRLFIVGTELNKRFSIINPSMTSDLQHFYPEIYQEHTKLRTHFIAERVKMNIEKGIAQGMYKTDIDIEKTTKNYISRLMDIHNPKKFPPENLHFHTVYNLLIEGFIKSIATTEGWRYYNSKVQLFGALGFGR